MITGCDGCKTETGHDNQQTVNEQPLPQQPSTPQTEFSDDWFRNPPSAPGFHYEVGTGISIDQGMAMNKARHDATRRLAQWQESRVVADTTGVTTNITSQATLQGAKVVKSEQLREGEMFRVYVLMELPLSLKTTGNEQKDGSAIK